MDDVHLHMSTLIPKDIEVWNTKEIQDDIQNKIKQLKEIDI